VVHQAGQRIGGGELLQPGAGVGLGEHQPDQAGELGERCDRALRDVAGAVVAGDERAPQAPVDVHGHGDPGALAHRDEPPRDVAVEQREVVDMRGQPGAPRSRRPNSRRAA